MNQPYTGHSIAAILILALTGVYLAGYGVMRMRCTGTAPCFVVFEDPNLIAIYKPLFYAERRLTGHHFSVSPWGMDVGFESMAMEPILSPRGSQSQTHHP